MKEHIAKAIDEQTKAAHVKGPDVGSYAAYIGLDVHKDTIAVAIALPGGEEPAYQGEIAHEPRKVGKWLDRLSAEFDGLVLLFCYEAGPCGYRLYRQLMEAGHGCLVVAPSLIPRKAGERIKTDRRDALKLARLLRAGELTPVWASPGEILGLILSLSRDGRVVGPNPSPARCEFCRPRPAPPPAAGRAVDRH